jgi:hypothetical protein
MPNKRSEVPEGKCRAKNKAGLPCAAPAQKGKRFCAIHLNPGRAAELGRKGGEGNRHIFPDDGVVVQAPRTVGEVRNMLAEVMAEIRGKRTDPKLGSTLAYIATSLLRAFEVAEFEDRLKRLEDANGLTKQAPQAGAERGGGLND